MVSFFAISKQKNIYLFKIILLKALLQATIKMKDPSRGAVNHIWLAIYW